MVYMGSKNRIAKYILPFLTKYLTPDRWYVEPFCGGLNMMDKICHSLKIANDSNNYLISMWEYLLYSNLDFPKHIDKDTYNRYKQIYYDKIYDKQICEEAAIIGWVGFHGFV